MELHILQTDEDIITHLFKEMKKNDVNILVIRLLEQMLKISGYII
jgi:hypothetical protein